MLLVAHPFSLWNCFQGYYFLFLHRLSVVSNNIEGKGLVALSQSMKTNPTLSHIYIWGNKFDEATCVVSLSSLRFFPGAFPTTSDGIY